MTETETNTARQIVDQWYWQPDSWRRTSFVRFYESAPMASDIFKLVLDYLKSETATSIVMAGKLIELGETWKATDAWYQTMPAEKWQGTESTKVRIYQAFRAESDTSAGPYSVENGCQYAVTHQFYWDVAEVPEVPASSSGVIYALQGVVRDKESGLYSCVLECRTRVQQDVPEYVTSKNVFAEQKEEAHIGVRQQDIATTGKAASVGNGTTVTRKVTKNPDCTSDVQNVTTVDKEVADAAETVAELATGTRTTTENRNMSAKASASGLGPGESVRNEKTESGLWNQTIVKFTRNASVWIGEMCRKTVFAHVHRTTTNEKSKPSFDHVVEAGNGKVVEKSVRKTDDGYVVEQQETVDKPVSDAAVETRRTLRGTTRTVTHRNQLEPLAMTGLAVGEQRRSQKTDGGLYDNTEVTTDAQAAGRIASSCLKSAAVHEDAKTVNMPGAEADTACVDNPDTNKVVEKSVRMTDDGTADVTTRTVTHHPLDSGEKSWHDDENVHVVRRYKNQPAIILPESATPGKKSVFFSHNEHASLDGGYEITSPRTAGVDGNGFGIRIIDEDLDITYASGRHYGTWNWTNNLNVTGSFWWVWQFRRVATMRVRWIGLTAAEASNLKDILDQQFTRQIYESVWNPNGAPGSFADRSGGQMRMSKVVKHHISGSVWGVLLQVNEQTTRMRTSYQTEGTIDTSLFWFENILWNYNLPDGVENVG